ncbi:MAG: iron-containing alcohol dehydrogenase [Chlorobium sp.]|uniref:iron-containing alcohol dehydrogenase n=1 Tax=Chlorobium sp. TaxID=1095 RepID=UPI0025BA49DA|nr:iron-containing alcohol dehydrogenase [Chlorobium sp.]MCF8215657.1 iron-containing alcohol dehydrogenase [Chlorobium sp.]MCF8270712.1 iron-containing alcohol dehydrogenase [Chlorobium sp.]MCF8286866.1 iron-containing alcohol dehydrogenase [Chlorobium sp.]MCF8290558.1 iron-containing alcohol dehydrogenase [Chlorobium sp.]MCF8384514.1 iron-containing alcohol dehydrogenase [Chlorobium sp.]
MKFEFRNPTHLVFGAGTLSKLGEVASAHGKKALLVTGSGSVRRNGTLDRALSSLHTAGVETAECSGVEPNPRLSTVERGAAIARSEGCDVIVALGGGSTMDAAKVMAAAVFYEGDLWQMMAGQENRILPTKALPVVTVPTLAATGSEMNGGAVISNEKTTVKSFVSAPCLYPKDAIIDPELTASVPPDQTAFGICDLITHVTESYFNGVDGTPLQDRFAEGVMLTAMEWGPKAIADGSDIEARTQVQWASVVALNGWVQAGTLSPYPVHMIEHTLSAHHDIAHGAGLAIVNPAWMRFAAGTRPSRFAQFAHRIFGITLKTPEDPDAAAEGIDRFEAFLRSTGCPTRLSETGIGDRLLERYASDTVLVAHDSEGRLPGRPPISKSDIVDILRSAL